MTHRAAPASKATLSAMSPGVPSRSSAVVAPTEAIDESFAILTRHLERVALEGRVRTSVGSAAQMILDRLADDADPPVDRPSGG